MPSTLVSKFNEFFTGATIPLRALILILHHPKLLSLSLAPILITILVFALMIYLMLTGVWSLAHSSYLAFVGDYSGVAFAVLSLLVISALGFFSVSLLTFLMSLCASPFNDVLAEKTEIKIGLTDAPSWTAGRFIRTLWIDLRKSVVSIFSAVVFGLGMLVPVANILFFVGLALLNTFTFITYPQSRRQQGLIQSLVWIRSNFFLSLGFGIVTLLLFSIPVVDLLILPISVVGGTMLYAESLKD